MKIKVIKTFKKITKRTKDPRSPNNKQDKVAITSLGFLEGSTTCCRLQK
jgi:hypothetical protein